MQGHSGNIMEIEGDPPEAPNSERLTIGGHVVHISGQDFDWQAWLNTEMADFDGVCIAVGTSRESCFDKAVELLEGILPKLIVTRGNPPS